MFNIPFGVIPQTEIVEIGHPRTGTVHLAKYWGRTANERSFIDALEKDQVSLELNILKITRDISLTKEIPLEEAVILVSNLDSNRELIAEYITELEPLFKKKFTDQDYKDQIVLLFFKERLAFPVTAKKFVKGSTLQEIHPSAYDIQAGSQIKFKEATVELASNVYKGATEIQLKQELFTQIDSNSYGYLWDSSKHDYILGVPEITLEAINDNRMVREPLKDAVFAFYQLEAVGGETPEVEENQKKDQQMSGSETSKSSTDDRSQTGKISTSKRLATQSQTKSSTESEALETVS